jgi:DUF2075 family protein/broad-specificity NMP kinase
MIIYSKTKKEFVDDVLANRIEEEINREYEKKIGRTTKSEFRSWMNSMNYMSNALMAAATPDDAMVAIEYQVPNTSKRVDFLLSGRDEQDKDTIVIVELKQWDSVQKTSKDGVVRTALGGGLRDVVHPSQQAYTYARLIKEYNEVVQDLDIDIHACAYLHNLAADSCGIDVVDRWYQEYLEKAPLFLRSDTSKLNDFLKQYIRYGERNNILYKIDHGRIRPSKSLADAVSSMLKGNKEFEMVDDQKVVFESIKELVLDNPSQQKRTIIIQGGPGTGKSVVAINLLSTFNNHQKNSFYVSANSAPREVYSSYLKGNFKQHFIDNLFKGSGAFTESPPNQFDVLLIDEAHRLKEKSGFYGNQGFHQIQELIHASIVSVFFIDEDQTVHIKDVGDIETIQMFAKELGSEIHTYQLQSQFRCAGSDGYIAWLDHVLGIQETANPILDLNEYDFKVFDDPHEMRQAIIEKNKVNNKSRIVAGYCWDWPTDKRRDMGFNDIIIPEHNFEMKWNLADDGQTWLIQDHSIDQAGCIHTCQGLELEYVGVIIGDDLRIENGQLITDVSKRSTMDHSVKGFKTALKNNDQEYLEKADRIIRNTYRTLMSRGLKGCYVYIIDSELKELIIKSFQ